MMNSNLSQNPKRSRVHFLIITFSTLLLIILSLTTVVKFTSKPPSLSLFPKEPISHIHIHKRIQTQTAILQCNGARYQDLCVSTLTRIIPNLASTSLPDIISATVNETISDVRSTDFNVSNIERKLPHLTLLEKRALEDCHTLFLQTVTELKTVVSDLSSSPSKKYVDLQTMLSAAMTNQATCLDGFEGSKNQVKISRHFRKALKGITRQVSNSLALLKKINGTSSETFTNQVDTSSRFPKWVKMGDRKLLQTTTTNETTKYDLIVAQDGSGNYTTINEAVNAAPNASTTRFVIYIKAGAYYEYVEVINKKRNLMFVGDGIGKTLIKGNRNVVDGWTTFRSATVIVVGANFMAKGITIENYAGPSKHQAVALRSGSDFSVFYQCSFVAYQDTLYAHSLRQFYRECDIYGTVDFVFGNAAVVFQKSNFYARKPDPTQKNIFTAQGRDDPNQNTGMSIIECKIAAGSELIPNQTMFKSYLGRPWKEFSKTVIIRSYIGDLIEPAGWLEWNASNFALSTLYYGEYLNRGPGSNTSARVTWPGYRLLNETEASQFTVANFIQGGEWLNGTGVPFYLDLQQNLTLLS
ncbi:pectinesterase, catalytic [Artemisia annua]|uniref:Pectinesterase n=1 Tax=Artemisia annua TaxID=35608 RepID=A0A2U1L8V2_ARTAN|nr:pectinesterase, catalytic [Artemisia annua]PWA89596.1 pectinesterase, catalytic [Artemisia annua]